jgi:hypothetical protein
MKDKTWEMPKKYPRSQHEEQRASEGQQSLRTIAEKHGVRSKQPREKKNLQVGIVVYTYNSSIQEDEAGGP